MPQNPYEIMFGQRHDATPGKTPASAESYNKLQEATDGIMWATKHEQYNVDRFVGDVDPDLTTVDGNGDDRSGHDYTYGYLKSIVGRDFYVRRPDTGNDITDQVREFCKTNRPQSTSPNDKDFGLNFRYVFGHNVFAVEDNAVLAKTINSGLVLDGINFTDVGELYSRLDLRGVYSTNATVAVAAGVGSVTITGVNFYDQYINPGDIVWLPNDVGNKAYRVTQVLSATQLELDRPPGTTGAGQVCHVLRGPVVFRRCRFENTPWVNNTYGLLFHDCEFVYDEDNSQYGGLFACPTTYPTDDPGAFINLRVVNCRFVQRTNDMVARPAPASPTVFAAMCLLENGWGHSFIGNHYIRMGTAGATNGVLVANAAGSSTRTGVGGIAIGNQEMNATTMFNNTQRSNHYSGVFQLNDGMNIFNGAAI